MSTSLKCPACQETMESDARYCGYCGHNLVDSESSPEPGAPAGPLDAPPDGGILSPLPIDNAGDNVVMPDPGAEAFAETFAANRPAEEQEEELEDAPTKIKKSGGADFENAPTGIRKDGAAPGEPGAPIQAEGSRVPPEVVELLLPIDTDSLKPESALRPETLEEKPGPEEE